MGRNGRSIASDGKPAARQDSTSDFRIPAEIVQVFVEQWLSGTTQTLNLMFNTSPSLMM
jgi:hypothetical protein